MDKKRVAAIAFTYTGAVVGAGFSSGREIWHFFARHQLSGFAGILLITIFFTGLAPFLFQLGKRLGIDSYHQFFYKYLPFSSALFFDLIYSFFLLGSVAVMFAGGGAIFRDVFGIEFFTGILIIAVVVMAVLYLKIEGVFTANTYLMPLLIVITVITVFNYLPTINPGFLQSTLSPTSGADWFLDAVLYGGYNISIAVAVMTGLVKQEKECNIFWGGFWGGTFLIILNLVIFAGLITAFHSSPREEIPMLYLAIKAGKAGYFTYVIALFFAMISTAIVNLFALNKRVISIFNTGYEYGLLLSAFLVIPLARSGFTKLVEILYPVYGYLGLGIIGFYIFLWIRDLIDSVDN